MGNKLNIAVVGVFGLFLIMFVSILVFSPMNKPSLHEANATATTYNLGQYIYGDVSNGYYFHGFIYNSGLTTLVIGHRGGYGMSDMYVLGVKVGNGFRLGDRIYLVRDFSIAEGWITLEQT